MKVLRKYRLQFAADPRFIDKLETIRSLLSTTHPCGISLEELFELLMDEYIGRHSPQARAERRMIRRSKNVQKADVRRPDAGSGGSGHSEVSRAISRRIRDEVFLRDGGRCTFIGSDGRRCGSRHNLQIDHIIPHALGGDNSPRNLRLLCGKHNRLEAERIFGRPCAGRSGEPDDRGRGGGMR